MGRLPGAGAPDKEVRPGAMGEGAPAFLEELHRAKNSQEKVQLDGLMKQIGRLGEELARQRTIANLHKYKETVKQFLAATVNRNYRVKEEGRWDRRGRHKLFVIIEQIDVRLEELAKMVMEGQGDTLDILAKLDEIRGLLLDIYS